MIPFDFDIQERMNLQRSLLKKVNSHCALPFHLNGLSQSAIDTWVKSNQKIDSQLIQILQKVSNSLLVLSTKSQESIDVQDLNISDLKSNLTSLDKILTNFKN